VVPLAEHRTIWGGRPDCPHLALPTGHHALWLGVIEIERIGGFTDPYLPTEVQDRTVFFDVVPVPTPWLA
jgi:hypothetical protein